MASFNGTFPVLPPWLVNSNGTSDPPSVTLSLLPSAIAATPHTPPACEGNSVISELFECCRELEKGHFAWAAHTKEAAWRLRRVELQLESEKAIRRREKMEEIEAKVTALREEEKAVLEQIEAEFREQLASLRRDAEAKEQKLSENWAAKHTRLAKFLEQMGCSPRFAD